MTPRIPDKAGRERKEFRRRGRGVHCPEMLCSYVALSRDPKVTTAMVTRPRPSQQGQLAFSQEALTVLCEIQNEKEKWNMKGSRGHRSEGVGGWGCRWA